MSSGHLQTAGQYLGLPRKTGNVNTEASYESRRLFLMPGKRADVVIGHYGWGRKGLQLPPTNMEKLLFYVTQRNFA